MADSRIQQAILCLVVLPYCFVKAKTPAANEARNKVVRCTTLTCITAANVGPAASCFELSKSSTQRSGYVPILVTLLRGLTWSLSCRIPVLG